jgi:hypothetical protein
MWLRHYKHTNNQESELKNKKSHDLKLQITPYDIYFLFGFSIHGLHIGFTVRVVPPELISIGYM